MGAIDTFTHDLPKSIKSFDTGNNVPFTYEAYVYRFTNLDNNKVYVGVHKGYVNDGYWHSSTNEEFNKIFSDNDSNLKLEILAYGNFNDMLLEEARILKRNDAKNNPMFYNKTNGSASSLPPDIELMEELSTAIMSRKFPVTKELIVDIDSLPRLQVRLEEDKEHRRDIKERIEDAGGNTDKCFPIVIYVNRGRKGEDIIGDGNHTLGGAKDAKHCTHVPVIRVPKEVHKKYSDEELIGVGNLLNKKPEILKKSMSVADAIKYIVSVTNTGMSHDSESNKRYLSACGFTKKRIAVILQKAKEEIERAGLRLKGQVWVNYTEPVHRATLDATVEGFKNSDTMCLAVSSAMFKWDNIFNLVFAHTEEDKKNRGSYKPTKTNLVIVVYHPNLDGEEKWRTTYQPDVYRKLKYFLEPLGYTCRIHEMPITFTNTPLNG